MRTSKYTLPVSILALIFTLLMVFTLPAKGATDPAGNPTTYEELSTGRWMLTDTKVEVFNKSNITKWTPSGNTVNSFTTWVDKLNIEHTVSSNFKLNDPPQMMPVGADFTLQENYFNDEYSTTTRTVVGIKVSIDKAGTNPLALTSEATEIMNLVKDNRAHQNEVKTGFFTAPKRFLDDSRQFQLTVDCFSGNDHYVTTYTYTYQN